MVAGDVGRPGRAGPRGMRGLPQVVSGAGVPAALQPLQYHAAVAGALGRVGIIGYGFGAAVAHWPQLPLRYPWAVR
jgi:hypothetical protein